jgi:hypothetical protein
MVSRPKFRPDNVDTRERRSTFALLPPAAPKQELKDRLMAAVECFNGDLVVHTWTYKLDKAA